MTYEIRPATIRDLSEIYDIELAQFPEPWTKSMLKDEITNIATRRYTVATENTKLVGYLGLMFVVDEVHVNTIGVVPGTERRGIGRTLLSEGLAAAHQRGAQRATLEVAASNVAAQALYRQFGFAPVGVRRNYYDKTGEDALILWADLPVAPRDDLRL